MNTKQPLRDESQLSDAQIAKIWMHSFESVRHYGTALEQHFARAIEAEVRSLRSQKPVAWDVVAAPDELVRLREEVIELDQLRDKLAGILSRTAVALRGPEPPLTRWSWHDLPELAAAAVATGVTNEMVTRFLGWKLPTDFSPDAGITFKPDFNVGTPWPMKHEPTGTNLLNGEQARAMLAHVLNVAPKEALTEQQIIGLANSLPGVGDSISGMNAIAFGRGIEALAHGVPGVAAPDVLSRQSPVEAQGGARTQSLRETLIVFDEDVVLTLALDAGYTPTDDFGDDELLSVVRHAIEQISRVAAPPSPVEADTLAEIAAWHEEQARNYRSAGSAQAGKRGAFISSEVLSSGAVVHEKFAATIRAASPSDTSQGVSEATAWLIESKFSGVQASWWNGLPLGGGQSFTSDPNAAIRFPRKEDAERVAMHMHMTIVTEHKWI